MGAQQGKLQGQPPAGYPGSPMPPPPPPLSGAAGNDGTHPPRQASRIKGLKPRQAQHHSAAPRSPLASQTSPGGGGMLMAGQPIPASPLASNIFAEHNGKTSTS